MVSVVTSCRYNIPPPVALPTARAAGLADLEIIVDTRERYAYRFAGQAVTTVSRALPCGDYGVVADGRLVAAVERKSLPDLVSSVTNRKLRYALGDLAALPRAATIPIGFCETRSLAEEWTYRYLAAACQWAATEPAVQARTPTTDPDPLLLAVPTGRTPPSPKSGPGPVGPVSTSPTAAASPGGRDQGL